MKKILSRKDSRIVDLLIAHGVAGYGLYVLLVEYLGQRKSRRSREDVARIAYELHSDADTVRSVLEEFNLFDVTADAYFNLGKAPVEENLPTMEGKLQLSESEEDDSDSEGSDPDGKPELSSPNKPGLSSSMKRRNRRKLLHQFRN